MKRLLCILIAVLSLCAVCRADGQDEIEDAIPDGVQELVGDGDIEAEGFFKRLLAYAGDTLSDSLKPVLGRAVSVIAVSLLCSVLGIFAGGQTPDYVPLCGCAAITALCIGDIGSYIRLGAETVDQISVFSKVLLPAMCTLSAATGAVSTAAAKYAASALFMDLYISLMQGVILPCIYAYLAAGAAAAAFSSEALNAVSSALKWLVKAAMTVLSLGFTIYLGISSAIASGGDAIATKLTKTSISLFLPVVGGIISDAASSVVAGAQILRNSAGVLGLAAITAMCAAPLLKTALYYLSFKAASAMSSAFGTKELGQLTGSIGTAFGMMLGLIGACGIILFVSTVSCIRTVTG